MLYIIGQLLLPLMVTALVGGALSAVLFRKPRKVSGASDLKSTHGAIFVSYRRETSADAAGRIYDHLESAFGRQYVFKDVDSIPYGVDFASYIANVIGKCRVFLLLISPGWIEARHRDSGRRLDDPNDLVRIEVETALRAHQLTVFALLLNGAELPQSHELPESLKSVASLKAIRVRPDPDFRNDVKTLIQSVRRSRFSSPRSTLTLPPSSGATP